MLGKPGNKRSRTRGQNMLEYTVILGVVTAALMGMRIYFQRGVQAVIRVAADDYSNRTQGEQINDIELAAKKQIYQVEGKVLSSSASSGSWTQKVVNKGQSSIRTENNGTTSTTINSTSIGGDFGHR